MRDRRIQETSNTPLSVRIKFGVVVFGLISIFGSAAIFGPEMAKNQVNANSAPIVQIQEGTNWCGVDTLRPYFGSQADEAACICRLESEGNPNAVNRWNLPTELSVGLMQFNLRGGVVEQNWVRTGKPETNDLVEILKIYQATSCSEGLDGYPAGLLDACIAYYTNPRINLTFSSWFQSVEGWSPWGTAALCGLK